MGKKKIVRPEILEVQLHTIKGALDQLTGSEQTLALKEIRAYVEGA